MEYPVTFEQMSRQLNAWLEEGKFFSPDKVMMRTEVEPGVPNPGGTISLRLYTATHVYGIRAVAKPDKSYLGCVASCRMPRPGEKTTRGNDLPDGPFTQKTWNSILMSIVSYELEHIDNPCWD